MTGFVSVDNVIIPQSVIQGGHQFLRDVGATGREGLVLWIGQKDGATFNVTELVIPEQRGIRSNDGVCVVIEGNALARLNVDLYKRQLQLIAQVHSHPGAAYHSPMDDEYAIATKLGCLSLVVPDFATRPFSLAECASYRLSTDGEWMELSTDETNRLIHISSES
ncbi:hypothetical protein ACFL3P_05620 [Pseudomonadota bacterium]